MLNSLAVRVVQEEVLAAAEAAMTGLQHWSNEEEQEDVAEAVEVR